jgi:transposase InsO family protein
VAHLRTRLHTSIHIVGDRIAMACSIRRLPPELEFATDRLAGQVTEAFPWDEAPRHLLRDRDASFASAYTRRIRAMRIRDHPVAPRSWRNGHVERLIGSIRRECLDHIVVVGEADLRRVLKAYASYYNRVRTHLSLDKDTPFFRGRQTVGKIVSIPILGGLHHQYVRV